MCTSFGQSAPASPRWQQLVESLQEFFFFFLAHFVQIRNCFFCCCCCFCYKVTALFGFASRKSKLDFIVLTSRWTRYLCIFMKKLLLIKMMNYTKEKRRLMGEIRGSQGARGPTWLFFFFFLKILYIFFGAIHFLMFFCCLFSLFYFLILLCGVLRRENKWRTFSEKQL